MIDRCRDCARARNQINGRYCYSLWRYVEHDKGERPPCSVKRVWQLADGSTKEYWADDYEEPINLTNYDNKEADGQHYF